jgi:hypothetical protein
VLVESRQHGRGRFFLAESGFARLADALRYQSGDSSLHHPQVLEYLGNRPTVIVCPSAEAIAGHIREALEQLGAFLFYVVHRFRESRVHRIASFF